MECLHPPAGWCSACRLKFEHVVCSSTSSYRTKPVGKNTFFDKILQVQKIINDQIMMGFQRAINTYVSVDTSAASQAHIDFTLTLFWQLGGQKQEVPGVPETDAAAIQSAPDRSVWTLGQTCQSSVAVQDIGAKVWLTTRTEEQTLMSLCLFCAFLLVASLCRDLRKPLLLIVCQVAGDFAVT